MEVTHLDGAGWSWQLGRKGVFREMSAGREGRDGFNWRLVHTAHGTETGGRQSAPQGRRRSPSRGELTDYGPSPGCAGSGQAGSPHWATAFCSQRRYGPRRPARPPPVRDSPAPCGGSRPIVHAEPTPFLSLFLLICSRIIWTRKLWGEKNCLV